jgi:hypothetical protein
MAKGVALRVKRIQRPGLKETKAMFPVLPATEGHEAGSGVEWIVEELF